MTIITKIVDGVEKKYVKLSEEELKERSTKLNKKDKFKKFKKQ